MSIVREFFIWTSGLFIVNPLWVFFTGKKREDAARRGPDPAHPLSTEEEETASTRKVMTSSVSPRIVSHFRCDRHIYDRFDGLCVPPHSQQRPVRHHQFELRRILRKVIGLCLNLAQLIDTGGLILGYLQAL